LIFRDTLEIILGALVIALASQISFEVNLGALSEFVPITGQTFAVITVAMLVRKWNAVLAVILYLFAGGLGLPVFADGASGWGHLSGATAGYLWSFLLVSWLLDRHDFHNASYRELLLLQLLASTLILMLGWFRLTFITEEAYANGVHPFLIGAVIKSMLGALVVWIFFWIKKNYARA